MHSVIWHLHMSFNFKQISVKPENPIIGMYTLLRNRIESGAKKRNKEDIKTTQSSEEVEPGISSVKIS